MPPNDISPTMPPSSNSRVRLETLILTRLPKRLSWTSRRLRRRSRPERRWGAPQRGHRRAREGRCPAPKSAGSSAMRWWTGIFSLWLKGHRALRTGRNRACFFMPEPEYSIYLSELRSNRDGKTGQEKADASFKRPSQAIQEEGLRISFRRSVIDGER